MNRLSALDYELNPQEEAAYLDTHSLILVRIPLRLPTRTVSLGYVRLVTVARVAVPVLNLLATFSLIWIGLQSFPSAPPSCTC
jgi:hypothetical protein